MGGLQMLRSILAILAVILAGGDLSAQEEPLRPPPSAGESVVEQTYPEVRVTPESSEAPGEGPGDAGTAGSGGPVNYPSLSEQVFGAGEPFGGLNGVTRGAKSVFEAPSLSTIVNREALVEKQATDMFQALQNEVGVLMQSSAGGQTSPFVRGLTGQQVLILVDGIRLNNSIFRTGPNQYFNLIDPGQVERIEVVRGPESVLWGSDAIGGAINVVTRSAAQDQGSYGGAGFTEYFSTADTGSYSRANVEGWVGRSGVFSGASYLNANDLDRGGDLGRQPWTGYHQYAGDLKYNYMLSCDAMLTVAMQHFEQDDVPRSDRFPPFVDGPPAGTNRPTWNDPQQRDLAYIRLQGRSGNALFDDYTTTFSYGRNKEGYREIRSETRIDEGQFDADTLGFTTTFARDLDWVGRFIYGLDYYHDDVSSFHNRIDPTTGAVAPDNPQFPDGSTYGRAGVFLSWDVDLTDRLTVTTGVRFENDDAAGTINAVRGTPAAFDKNYHDWITNVGLSYKLSEPFRVFGSVAEGYRAPNLDDLAADNPVNFATDLPSLGVQPEHAWTYEIGLKLNTPRLRMQISEYWVDLEDNILRQAVDANGNPAPNVIGPYGTVIPGSNNFIRSNFDCYVNGTELVGEYLLEGGWSVYGNAWYTYGLDLERLEPLSRIPPLQGLAGVRWRDDCGRKWFEVYTWLVARQDRYAAQNNIDPRFPLGGTPGYVTLNARMGTTWGCGNRHRLSLTLENITDQPYRVLGSGVDGAGFNAIVGDEWLL